MHPAPASALMIALQRERDPSERAERARRRRDAEHARPSSAGSQARLEPITVRWARAGDAMSLRRLGELDSASSEADRLAALARSEGDERPLVAETDGAIAAAFDPSRDLLVADPFRHTAAAGELLRVRAGQLRGYRHARAPLSLRALWRGRPRPRTS